MRRSSLACLPLVLFSLCSRIAPGGENQVRGTLDAVTVYRGEALVTRVVDVKAPAGLQEVIVTDLPARVIAGSIYAEAGDGVEVRSVLYRERAVDKDVRDDVRKLDDQLRTLQDKQAANKRFKEVLNDRKNYLTKLEQFTAPTATFELSKGVLNADTLQKMTTYQFEQLQSIATEDLKLSNEERDLGEQLSTLTRQRSELTGGSAKTVREALVFVNLAKADGTLRLRYLVDQATWLPSYNLRADGKREKVTVQYNASIQQMSGEDWTNVQMTLSTATPSMVARPPSLAPLNLTLAPIAQTKIVVTNSDEYGAQREQIVEKRNRAQIGRNFDNGAQPDFQITQSANGVSPFNNNAQNNENKGNRGNPLSADIDLNDIAGELQMLDLNVKGKVAKPAGKRRPTVDESVSVTYDLNGRLSLPSRADNQLIQIAALPMKPVFFKVAVPLLTNYVYDEAELINDSKLVLLAGSASAFIGQQFVGRGELPTVASGETFTAGFGIDASLRTERELVEKTDSVQGGNRVLSFTYQLQVENFGADAINIRLYDRLPAAKENEIHVTAMPTTPELSKDPMYEKNEHKRGLLRWETSVPAKAIGAKAFALTYQFQLEFDRQMNIAQPAPLHALTPAEFLGF